MLGFTVFVFWLICGFCAGFIARQRGGNGCLWLLIGFCFGPLATVASFAVSPSGRCPACFKAIDPRATKCPYCQSAVVPSRSEAQPATTLPNRVESSSQTAKPQAFGNEWMIGGALLALLVVVVLIVARQSSGGVKAGPAITTEAAVCNLQDPQHPGATVILENRTNVQVIRVEGARSEIVVSDTDHRGKSCWIDTKALALPAVRHE